MNPLFRPLSAPAADIAPLQTGFIPSTHCAVSPLFACVSPGHACAVERATGLQQAHHLHRRPFAPRAAGMPLEGPEQHGELEFLGWGQSHASAEMCWCCVPTPPGARALVALLLAGSASTATYSASIACTALATGSLQLQRFRRRPRLRLRLRRKGCQRSPACAQSSPDGPHRYALYLPASRH
jgi:hypothetical protein